MAGRLALAAHRPSWLVATLVLVAAVVHVLGERWLSTATGAVVFDLAPESAQGQYQAVQQTGRQIGNLAAPPLLTTLVVGLGGPGWLGVAAVFAAIAWAAPGDRPPRAEPPAGPGGRRRGLSPVATIRRRASTIRPTYPGRYRRGYRSSRS